MYISEFAEISIRGALGAFFQLFLTVGILFVYAIGPYVSWVLLSVMCAVFPALLIVAMFIVPESPTYLVKTVSLSAVSWSSFLVDNELHFFRVDAVRRLWL